MKIKLLAAASVAGLAVYVGVAGAAHTKTSAFDQHWLQAALQGDRYEIAVGKIVLQKGSGDACQVGQMLVTDHGKSLRETSRVARQAGVAVPNQPSPVEQVIIQELSRQSGLGFQSMFANFGVGDHKQDISDAREAAAKAQLPSVRNLARHELPTLRKHLAAFEKLAKSSSAALAATATNPTSTSGNSTTTTQAGSTTGGTTETTTTAAGPVTGSAGAQAGGGCSGNPAATTGK